ncbi:T9SS type A sorting domain-containing protein [Dysgonomonas sp. ZJ709]|uniref:T9SS type A sorting domain-containing protein n=1 Tax=Dysgonomonas sp. ZJ709 TaxID=2709797 RepID=UPI0013ED713F|nr:T9SS type A sorting domain-containing protein [Dysgonomonas sp. ZJ709]
MVQFNKIFCLLLFIGCSLSVDAEGSVISIEIEDAVAVDNKEITMNLDILINSTTRTQLQNVPTKGYLEVYSILGSKVTSKNLQNCLGGCELELPKGLYILKAGKVTQKIIVR